MLFREPKKMPIFHRKAPTSRNISSLLLIKQGLTIRGQGGHITYLKAEGRAESSVQLSIASLTGAEGMGASGQILQESCWMGFSRTSSLSHVGKDKR